MSNSAQGALGTIYEDVRCIVTIAGLESAAIRVASVGGTERLSTLFSYTLEVATSPDDVSSLEDALGKDVAIEIQRDGNYERGVHGILTEVFPDGAYVGKNLVRTMLTVEPRLANLQYSGGFKIFQKMTVKDIVTTLVQPERLDVVWRLRPDPPTRDYRTQLDESDYDFLARLAADEGLTFFFESTKDKTSLVFTNSPKGFQALDGESSFPFCETEGAIHVEHVRSVQRGRRVRTGAVEHRDYDFTNPRVALVARADTGGKNGEADTTRREWRDYPGGFTDPDGEGKPRATMRLEELRVDSKILAGTAWSMRLAAGKKFTITGHDDAAFNGDFIVTDVSIGAGVEGAFAGPGDGRDARATAGLSQFTAVSADTPIRPRRLAKPASRLQTARVVGPKDGDPNVDKYGRINVQFVWDRDGKFDANSSCWIRMATPNAHANEGFWQAHRVGSEVLVDFIDGDVDRPVVIGALYNGHETQPYAQPGGVTRSTWKTRGIPGGSGYNEITFENSSGSEQIILHAQKDLNETILNDHTESIGQDQSSSVGNNQKIKIAVNRNLDVGTDETIAVGHDQSITVGNNQTTIVKQAQKNDIRDTRTTTIKNDDSTTVGGDAKRFVKGDDQLIIVGKRKMGVLDDEEKLVLGAQKLGVMKDQSTTVMGDRSAKVKGDDETEIGGERKVSVKKTNSLEVEKGMTVTVKEDYAIKVGDNITVTFSKSGDVELKTGDASITMSKDGTIDIKGKSVTVESSSDMAVKGDSVTVKGSSKVAIN